MSIVLYYPSINDSNKFYTILSSGIFILQKISTSLTDIDVDLEIALSQIESGCMTTIISDTNILIVKEKSISFFEEIDKIDISFEHIERPEFPTIALRLKIKTTNNLNLRYEYFFLTESKDEIHFLNLLVKNESIRILFVSNEIKTERDEKINIDQINNLSSILLKLDLPS